MNKYFPVVLLGCLMASVGCVKPLSPFYPGYLTPTPTATLVPSTPSPSVTLSPTKTSTPIAVNTATPTPSSTPIPSATPSPMTTSVCSFATITVPLPTITPISYPTPVGTIIPYGPVSGPVPPITATPGTFLYSPPGYVVRSIADWQALYGSGSLPPASVDFSSQMILLYVTENCPCQVLGFTNVCETSTEVDVTVANYTICNLACPPLSQVGYRDVAVVVPISNLPVVWTIGP